MATTFKPSRKGALIDYLPLKVTGPGGCDFPFPISSNWHWNPLIDRMNQPRLAQYLFGHFKSRMRGWSVRPIRCYRAKQSKKVYSPWIRLMECTYAVSRLSKVRKVGRWFSWAERMWFVTANLHFSNPENQNLLHIWRSFPPFRRFFRRTWEFCSDRLSNSWLIIIPGSRKGKMKNWNWSDPPIFLTLVCWIRRGPFAASSQNYALDHNYEELAQHPPIVSVFF